MEFSNHQVILLLENRQWEQAIELLCSLPVEERIRCFKEEGLQGSPLLETLAMSASATDWSALMQGVPADQQVECLSTLCGNDNTAIYWIVFTGGGDRLAAAFEALEPDQIVGLLEQRDKLGSPLMRSVMMGNSTEQVQAAFKKLTPAQRTHCLDLHDSPDGTGETALHTLATLIYRRSEWEEHSNLNVYNPQMLEAALEGLSSEKVSLLTRVDDDGNTVLHSLVEHGQPEFLRIALKGLSVDEKTKCLNARDGKGKSVLYRIVQQNRKNQVLQAAGLAQEEGMLEVALKDIPHDDIPSLYKECGVSMKPRNSKKPGKDESLPPPPGF